MRGLGAELRERDLGKAPLSEAELAELIGSADVTTFLNTRSAAYRQHGFKGSPPTKAQAIKLMALDSNLIKRPIIVRGLTKILGFNETDLRALVS